MKPDLKLLLLRSNVEEPSDELVSKREQAIEKYLQKNTSFTNYLGLVRLVFSLEDSVTFVENFRKVFIEFDPEFPDRGRTYEIKILAYATILSVLFQEESNINQLALSLAVNNCFGFGLRERPRDIDIVKIAEEAFQLEMVKLRSRTDARSLRENTIAELNKFRASVKSTESSEPELETPKLFNELVKLIDVFAVNVLNVLDEVINSTHTNETELQMLWWAYSNESVTFHKPWSNLKWVDSSMAVGKELSDLVTMGPGPITYATTIMRILDMTTDKPPETTTLPTFVQSTPQKLRGVMLEQVSSFIDELTPIHFAIMKSLESSSKKKFNGSLETAKIKISKRLAPSTIAIQIYRERIYLKNYATTGDQ